MAGLSGSHAMFAESFNALSICHGGTAEWPTLEAASPNPLVFLRSIQSSSGHPILQSKSYTGLKSQIKLMRQFAKIICVDVSNRGFHCQGLWFGCAAWFGSAKFQQEARGCFIGSGSNLA